MTICITDMDNGNLYRISRSLNAMLNVIIGPEVYINIRTTTKNLMDDIHSIQCKIEDTESVQIYSGSQAEGLRFKTSDFDWMILFRKIKVIPSDSYTANYNRNTTLLMMENEMTKPGFTLLRLIGQSTKPMVTRSIEHIMNGRYLSCKRWRELHTAQSEFTHGPCASGEILGALEYDKAFCLRCDTWPANARDCIRRLHQSAWPSHDTVLSIVNDGVLFVPIGAKESIFENTEWRMSFSLAEKKLIHAMNHTQFLCYGLLKIFLKEAIDVNPDVKGLLCSYFLKTALFWEITTTRNKWNPSTLLSHFWNCLLRLLQWVSCSYCPNFFIPMNNMFGGKIEGTNRDNLLQHLRILYYEGYSCLLRCRSLADRMSLAIYKNMEFVLEEIAEATIAQEILQECYRFALGFGYKCNTSIAIKIVLMRHLASPTNSHQRYLLKTWFHHYMTQRSLRGTISPNTGRCNRSCYNNLTEGMNIMRRCQTDSISHFLYQAMLCYKDGWYTHALKLTEQFKEKISDPSSIYWHKTTRKRVRNTSLDNLPTEKILRRPFCDLIMIYTDSIPELHLERHYSMYHPAVAQVLQGSFTPLLVCAFFLQYLCQRKLSHLRESDDALYELSLLVQHDDGRHINILGRLISWQILGICQQINGDDRAACQSFMIAQCQSKDKDSFKVSTSIRLGTILVKYLK